MTLFPSQDSSKKIKPTKPTKLEVREVTGTLPPKLFYL